MKVVAVLLALSVQATSLALAQESADTQRYKLKGDEKLFGFSMGSPIGNAESRIPFDRTFGQLTPEQQAMIRFGYEEMSETDEPPFPVGGLGAIYDPVTEGQQRLGAEGAFNADVAIDREGNAVAVAVYRSPNKNVTKFVSSILLLTKFKPALCRGEPCAMSFPVRVNFEMR
jgi:hypothetical protein